MFCLTDFIQRLNVLVIAVLFKYIGLGICFVMRDELLYEPGSKFNVADLKMKVNTGI